MTLTLESLFIWRICLVFLLSSCSLSSPDKGASVALSLPDRSLYAEYLALGHESLPMIFAFDPSTTAAAATQIADQGGKVITQRNAIGYTYAVLPIDKIEMILQTDGLQAVQIPTSPLRSLASPPEDMSQTAPSKHPQGPSPTMKADNPFTAEKATQALQFKAAYPTFDGRGVTTAFPEPMAPNLQSMRGALDIEGKPVTKIAKYHIIRPPAASDEEIKALHPTEPVAADEEGQFIWKGTSYHLPEALLSARSGALRLCRCHQVDLSGGRTEYYDMLWAVDQGKVWVLPASRGRDYNNALSVDLRNPLPWVPVNDAAKQRETPGTPYGFILFADTARLELGVLTPGSKHANMVGSLMVGAGFLDSAADGIAPAAQTAPFDGVSQLGFPGYTSIEQILSMLEDPAIDVAQSSLFVSDTSRFGSRSPHEYWISRLIRESGRPLVQAVGNYGAALYGTMGFVNAEEVFSVGAYVPRDAWRANFGITPQNDHVLSPHSGYGPTKDGGLKPDFLALTNTLSEGYDSWYWPDWPGYEEYGVSGGTSAAAPHGAGHIALLISAAKQTGIPYDTPRLRAAIATTAKFFENVDARAQGHGLIQVKDAWDALQSAKDWTPPSLVFEAPLVNAESHNIHGPAHFTGRGLAEFSGWAPHQDGQRHIAITRASGAAGDKRYLLRWKGDTQAFHSPLEEILLPLGKKQTLPVDIQVDESGSYSAILDLIDPDNGLIAGSMLATVLVADPLPQSGKPLLYSSKAPRPGNTAFFIDVPAGLSALTVVLKYGEGAVGLTALDPAGRYLPFNSPWGSETGKIGSPYRDLPEQRIVYPDPAPGLWQFALRVSQPLSQAALDAVKNWHEPMPYDLSIRGRKITATVEKSLATEGPSPVKVQFDGADHGDIRPLGLGASRSETVTLKPGLVPRFFDVTVPPGATRLGIGFSDAPLDARIGLYLYKLPEDPKRKKWTPSAYYTALTYHDPSYQVEKHYTLASPPPGHYIVALDPITIPQEGVTISYRDTVYHPDYGTVTVTEDVGVKQASGIRGADVLVHLDTPPPSGRTSLAAIGLFDHPSPDKADPLATAIWSPLGIRN